ncbi:MAG TPA: hypothetical protein VIM79_23220 [Niastella sp.]
MALSNLGIFHTVIGVVAIASAITGFIKSGKIDLQKLPGKMYFYLTLITSLTALGLSSVKGLNPGHILALLVIILISAAYFLSAKRQGNNRARYFENFFLSFSFFLSMLPTVNETFTRIPVGHPLAAGPNDPLIGISILLLFIMLIAGSVLQFRKQRQLNRVV